MALVEKGSIGGVVTLADVANKTATRIGRTFAALLNTGFHFEQHYRLLVEKPFLATVTLHSVMEIALWCNLTVGFQVGQSFQQETMIYMMLK